MNNIHIASIGILIALCFVNLVISDVSHLVPSPVQQQQQQVPFQQQQHAPGASVGPVGNQHSQPPVTETCLGCICEAISGCNRTEKCAGDVCGLFRITWAYWSDSGKPTVAGESPSSQTAYANCANDPYCAASAVQGYMSRFGQDCNGDGVINCYDHAAIHMKGGYGCRGELPDKYNQVFQSCVGQFLRH